MCVYIYRSGAHEFVRMSTLCTSLTGNKVKKKYNNNDNNIILTSSCASPRFVPSLAGDKVPLQVVVYSSVWVK